MIAGALNFTLGLQANQFLNTLGTSSGKLLGMLGVANSISGAFHKMWGAIDQGGKLNDLAASANISVKTLYQLQRAFEEVGASADSVPSIINRLRRTLGGGEQNSLLSQMGLDPQKLAALDPGAQFESVAAALGKMNVNARSMAAQQIFGREGAATAMQIANSGGDFADSMKRAESDAEVWQRVAKTFDDIGDKVTSIMRHIETLWAKVTGAFIQAFRDGQLSEVITDIIATGFEAALAVVPAMFVKLGEVLLRAFQTPLAYLQAGIEFAIDQAANNPRIRKLLQLTPAGMAAVAGLDAMGITSGKQSSFQEILQARMEEGVKFNLGTGEFGIGEISSSANAYLGESAGRAGDILGKLGDRLNVFLEKLPQGKSVIGGPLTGNVFGGVKSTRTDVTSIEKMGGVLNGLGRGFSDDNRRTADNTRRTADLLVQIEKNTSKTGSIQILNQ